LSKRYLDRFTSLDGTIVYVWPTNRYEWETDEPVRSPRALMSGADHAFRLLGERRVLLDVAQHRVRCVFVGSDIEQDAHVDEMRAALYEGAYGWVWTKGATGRTRALAEISEMPRIHVSFDEWGYQPLVLGFNVFTPFYLGDQIDVSQAITANAQTWTVNNPGKATDRVILTVKGTFTNIKITNTTDVDLDGTGAINYEFESTRDGSSTNHIERLDTLRPAIEFSDDNGVTWHSDIGSHVRPPSSQAVYSFGLGEGANVLKFEGTTPTCTVRIIADARAY
jgi:hypothetical protein